MEFCDRFGRHFLIHGNDASGHARHYLSGLLGCARRENIGRIGEDVAGSNYQAMAQFISDSPWDPTALSDDVAREAGGLLGGTSVVKRRDAFGQAQRFCIE